MICWFGSYYLDSVYGCGFGVSMLMIVHFPLFWCADWSAFPKPCCVGTARGSWGIPCWAVRRHQPLCHPCQTGHHNAQGYPAG